MSDLIERLEAADEYFCGRDHEVFRDAKDALEAKDKRIAVLEAVIKQVIRESRTTKDGKEAIRVELWLSLNEALGEKE